jgi:SAM-dependent methyltransferase
MGSATTQEPLWGAKTQDWCEIQEPTMLPLYYTILNALNIERGSDLLDAGCGAGLFCELADARGINVSGIDATKNFLEIAAKRVADATFVHGDVEEMPFDDNSFDVVTSFNCFQYVENPVRAFLEVKRVTRPNGKIAVSVWGKQEDCDAAFYLRALGMLLPPPPPGSPGAFALSQDYVLERFATNAGLISGLIEEADCNWFYDDEEKAMRGLLSAGPAISAILHSGYDKVHAAVLNSIKQFKQSDGSYMLHNKFRYIIAAPGK